MQDARCDDIIEILKDRFAKNIRRHLGVEWRLVQERLAANPEKLRVLVAMEKTGGEPDVIGVDPGNGKIIFCDCSKESPTGRRGLCYDRAALDSRKENKPKGNAVDLATALGVEILNEYAYRQLQELGEFDCKTSSWIATPQDIRSRGGALFCDRRYDSVFVYHNGAESYYAARGFRGRLMV